MSNDKSTVACNTEISHQAMAGQKLKSGKVEQWEINLIGDFLLSLYHRSLIPQSDWCMKKSIARKEFALFITAELREKLNKLGIMDIGTLLHRCRFLVNMPRASVYYKINYSNLFEYRNNKLKELDNSKIKSDVVTKADNLKKPDDILKEVLDDDLEIAIDETKIPMEYQGTAVQLRFKGFQTTNMSCCICQENYSTIENYEEHIKIHGIDTDFEFLNSMSKFDSPIFTLYYRMCKNSHYFCLEFTTNTSDLIIEKIAIVQSRSFYYVQNARVPYKFPKTGQDRFFVDSHLFTIHVENPIVVICYLENKKETRFIEQHHFFRCVEFPKPNFAVNPYRLPSNKEFKRKRKLAGYFPSKEIQSALKDDFFIEELIRISKWFRDYVRSDKKLDPYTMAATLNILLQIEDIDTIKQYFHLVQQNVKVQNFGSEYSFKLKTKQRSLVENVLRVSDEVILTSNNISTEQENLMQLMLMDENDISLKIGKSFLGWVEYADNGRVSFKCKKKIDIHGTYTIICRPSRLNIRYQYRSLEWLGVSMPFLKNILFPTRLISRPLSSISLSLYNPTINDVPEQLQAVRNIAEGPRNDAAYIIFGPPGTGKTTTLVEAILQLLKRSDTKILITASSNSACDEVALRLCNHLKQLHISRAIVRIYSRSSEARTETIADELLEHSNMYNGQFYPDVEILHEYRIVVCTLSVVSALASGDFGRLRNEKSVYTHLFIDEVAATTEVEALAMIAAVYKPNSCLVIAGDHKQLGPIINSKRAAELGLNVSLMERLLTRECYRVNLDTDEYDRTIQTRLCRNFRSHPAIVELYSGMYYNHSLKSCAKMEDVSLGTFWNKLPNKDYPIIFHAVSGQCRSDYQSHSLYNLQELDVVMDYTKDLMYFGINGKPLKETDIGIISPYKKQYKYIEEELKLRKWFDIAVGPVETFQGKEKQIIIVSFVRSGMRTLGFLENSRRLNVILSRPQSLLILIGDPDTLSINGEFEFIIKQCQRNNTFVGKNMFYKSITHQSDTSSVRQQYLSQPQNLSLLDKSLQELSIADKKDNAKISAGRRGRRRNRKNLKYKKTNNQSNDMNKNKNRNKKDDNEDDDDDDDDEDDDDEDYGDDKDEISDGNGYTSNKTINEYQQPSTSAASGNNPFSQNISKRTKRVRRIIPDRRLFSHKITNYHYCNSNQAELKDNIKSVNDINIDSFLNELPKVPTYYVPTYSNIERNPINTASSRCSIFNDNKSSSSSGFIFKTENEVKQIPSASINPTMRQTSLTTSNVTGTPIANLRRYLDPNYFPVSNFNGAHDLAWGVDDHDLSFSSINEDKKEESKCVIL